MSDVDRQIADAELKRCDGREGRPAWVTFRGKVYDVSGSQRWPEGMHMKRHQAGQDLSGEFASAPHDESVFERVPVVGRLIATPQVGLHPWVDAYLDLHAHPVSVHFPIALTLTSAALLILNLATGIDSLVDGAYYALLCGAVVAPISAVTGVISWWYNHGRRLTPTFRGKAVLSIVLLAITVVTAVLWALNRDAVINREALGWVCFGLVIVMSVLVLSLGKLGGALVFPPRSRGRAGR